MANKPNSICAICGKEYYCCNDSMTAKSFTPWKKIVDKPEHYKIFTVLQDYTNEIITKEEAVRKLNNCDLNDKGTFKEDIRKVIDDILNEQKTVKIDKGTKSKKESDVDKISE